MSNVEEKLEPGADAERRVLDPILGEIPPDLLKLDAEEDAEDAEKLPTLAEVGRVLPIGFEDQNGERHRDFELVEWNWDLEEALGELAENESEMLLNQYVSELIGHGVKRIGSVDFSKLKRSQRRTLVRNLYFADALYLYVWIRIAALGHGLKFEPFKHCRGKYIERYVGDLRTLEVRTFDEGVPTREVKLEHGVQYAGKRLTDFTVGPIRWAFMETDDPGQLTNQAKYKKAVLRQGVVGLKGAPEGPVYLTREHLRSMKPREIDRLVDEIDQSNGGLVMEVRDRCPHCKKEFRHPINWRHDAFFAPSSH